MLDLAAFSQEDYATVLELASRFRALPMSGPRRLPALQGRLVTTLFFEPSTRTRSSFELAARRLSAEGSSSSAAGGCCCGDNLDDCFQLCNRESFSFLSVIVVLLAPDLMLYGKVANTLRVCQHGLPGPYFALP